MRRKKLKTSLLFLPAVAAFALLGLRSADASAAAQAGLENCIRTVIPALFPFLVLTNLLLRVDLPTFVTVFPGKVFEWLFSIPRSALPAFLGGLFGGYPLGAEAAAECSRLGLCSKEEAERLLIISNNCSPGFLFGLAAGKLDGGGQHALILLLLQWLISIFIGVLLGAGRRPTKADRSIGDTPSSTFIESFVVSVRNGGRSVLFISAYVVFFSVLMSFLPGSAILRGVFELTGGILLLPAGPEAAIIAAFLIGFGGLSVACQVLSSLEGTGISGRCYLPLRLLHGLLMAFGMYCLHLSGFHFLLYTACLFCIAVFVKTYGNRAKSGV